MLQRVTKEEMQKVIEWIPGVVEHANAHGVMIALSGGADSALVAALCVKALGTDRVLAVSIPIESVPSAQSDAHKIADWLKIQLHDRMLNRTLNLFMEEAAPTEFRNLSLKKQAMARGNVKARLRTTLTRLWAETHGLLMVNTCNWSETSVGYATKGGGDADGDLSPLDQFVKDDVWEMLRLLEAPEWIVNKIPSADLEVGQSDEADLGMSYKKLDRFARVMATEGLEAVKHLNQVDEQDLERFLSLVAGSAHKRAHMPVFERKGFTCHE